MATVRKAAAAAHAVEGGVDGAPTTFEFITSAGAHIVCGKPTGVQKLALRRILTAEQLKDNELKEIARACLAIVTFDGLKPILLNPNHFEALVTRFGTDEDIDGFMAKWQELNYPEVYNAMVSAVEEGTKEGLYGDALESFVAAKLQTIAKDRLEQVKN